MKYTLKFEVTGGTIDGNLLFLKDQLTQELEAFKDYVVANETEVPEGKDTLAKLRKIRKLIDDKRKEIKKEYLVPYDNFEKQVKDIINLIDDPILRIDTEIKTFENMWKDEKFNDIVEYFNASLPKLTKSNVVTLDKIFNDKWLNKTFKDKDWQQEIDDWITRINSALDVIFDTNGLDDVDKAQLLLDYINHDYDLGKAYEVFNDRKDITQEYVTEEMVTIPKKRYLQLIETEKLYKKLVEEE